MPPRAATAAVDDDDPDPDADASARSGPLDHDPGPGFRPLARPGAPTNVLDLARGVVAEWRARGPAAPALAALLVGVVGVAAWALVLRVPTPAPIEDVLPFASPPTAFGAAIDTPTSAAPPTVLVVHAAGAVMAPGVHEVPAGSRVADVLAAAGGPTPDADLDAVNLAAPVVDGGRVWFPRAGEVPPGQVAPGPSPPGSGSTGSPGEGAGSTPVDLNTASASELDALPGIGPSTAAAIVEHRERNGPFASVDDLIDVPGIGPAKLEQLRPLVRV